MCTDPKFQEMAWENLNDTIKSETIFRFPSKTIAGACIYLSACLVNISLQMCSDRGWLLFFEHHQEDIEAISRQLMAFRDRSTPQKDLEELKRMVGHASCALTLLEWEKKLKENLASVVDQMRPPHSNSSAENNPPNPDGKENKPEIKKSGIKSKANRDTNQQKRKRISPSANGMNKSHRKKSKIITYSGGILSSHAPSSSKHPPEVSRISTSQDQGSKVKVMRNDEIQMLKLEYEEES